MRQHLPIIPIAQALVLFTTFSTGAATAATKTVELAASPGETLVLDLESGGDIEVVGWDRDGASVTTEITGRDAGELRVDATRTSEGIRVESSTPHHRHRSSLLVKVNVPRRYDVRIETSGGDVRLDNLEGDFSGQTMGGDMELSRLAGEAKISTMGGDISVRSSTLDGKVSTMGGDVELEDLEGNLDASTMGGDITERNVRRSGRGAEAVTVSSHGGDVTVDEAPAGANVKTMGGDIEVRSVDQFLTAVTMGGDVTVQRATGDAEITTMGGDIEVESFDGGIEAKTMGGDVEVNVVSSSAASASHDIELDSMGGDLRLALPANFSGRFEVELVKLRKRPEDAYIDSEFPLDVVEPAEWTSGGGDRHYGGDYKVITATGTTGGGSHLVKLKTVSGVIRISRQ